jgi:hypothetical protein
MEHIRQKSSATGRSLNSTYTVVVTTGWTLPLTEHPSVVEHPEIFEIVNEEIPDHAQYLNYI